MTEMTANVNLFAIDYPKVASDIVGFTLRMLFISFTKTLHYAFNKYFVLHIQEFLSERSVWAACVNYVHRFLKIQSIKFIRIRYSVRFISA